MPRSPREERILQTLDGEGAISFQGLRRLLGLHPQALSRSLNRLKAQGLVAGGKEGYRLVDGKLPDEPGKAVLPPIPVERSVGLAAVLLQDPSAAALLESALAGRWFGNLRWLGKARMGGITVLAWLVEPEGVVLRLVLDGRHARVEVAQEAREEPAVHAGLHALLPAVGVALARGVPAVGPGAALARPLLLA